MVAVYYLRKGRGDNCVPAKLKLTLADIVHAFPNAKAIHAENPILLNEEKQAFSVSDPTHVVLHIEDGEAVGQFTKDGYWLFESLTPHEFSSAFRSIEA